MSGTLSRHSSRRRGAPRRHSQLFVVFQCDAPLSLPIRHALDGVNIVNLGRGDALEVSGTSNLTMRLPDGRMSSDHARLVFAGGQWVLEDRGSKNGVFVGAKRVDRAVLEDGCIFELGHTFFLYREVIAPEAHRTNLHGHISAPHPSLTSASSPLAAAYAKLARVAASDVPVLLRGASGTGKELAARAIHELSGRRGRFIAVNCGALAESLVQSELFGYRRGAFSGADEDRLGRVRSADGGTLFLDEIGDLVASSQAVLLRVLQEHEVTPLGTADPVPVDVRFVAATHQALDDMMDAGAFRRDLHARLAGFEFGLRPLAERREDLGLLTGILLKRHAGDAASEVAFSPEAARALFHHTWPLNVRELEQCLASALALADDGWIDLEQLPSAIAEERPPPPKQPRASVSLSKDDLAIRDRLMDVLARHGGNISAAARELDKDRKQIRRWVKRFAIDLTPYR